MTLAIPPYLKHPIVQIVIYILLANFLSFWVASQFLVNDNDNEIHQAAVEYFLKGQSPYNSSYIAPPHGVLMLLPWVMWGERITSFFNLLFVLLLYSGLSRRINWAALIFVISPVLLFVNASANITGITTGLGILIIFMGRKGTIRGLAWAMLALHPQEAGVILVLDGLYALYERDKWALGAGFLLCSPSLIWFGDWMAALDHYDVVDLHLERLSPLQNYGVLPILLVTSLIGGWLYHRRAYLRHYPEQLAWLANMVAWLWVNPYIQLYTLWIILIPLRWVSGWLTGALWLATLGVMLIFIRDYEPETWVNGVMCLMLLWIGVGLYTVKPVEKSDHVASSGDGAI